MKYQVGLSIFLLLVLIGTGESMKYTLTNEFNVAASANEVWAVYSSHSLPKLIVELLPAGTFESIDVVKGDGGVGTILRLVYPPGSVPLTYKEKFVTIDNRRRLKEVLQIEGGYLEMGVTFFMNSFQIIEKGRDSCIIRSMTKYEVRDDVAAKVSPLISVDTLVTLGRAISKYVIENKKKANSTIAHLHSLVLRDHTGAFKGARCIPSHAIDAENAEASTLLVAVDFVEELKLNKIISRSSWHLKHHHHPHHPMTRPT